MLKREDRPLFVALLAIACALAINGIAAPLNARDPLHTVSDNHDAIEAVAAVAAVVAAVWLAIVTGYLWGATRDLAGSTKHLATAATDQVEEMRKGREVAEEQCRVAQRQLDISADQLRTAREQSRAFVFIEDIEYRVATRFQRGGFDPDVGGFTMTPRWKNSGDTPTVGLTLRARAYAHPGDLPTNYGYTYERTATQAMIGPKGNEWSEAFDLTANTANRVLDGEWKLYVWGRAEYQDVFGRARFTEFCSRVDFVSIDREIVARFTPYGPHNRSDAETEASS